MTLIQKVEKRRVIPRWRDTRVAVEMGEASSLRPPRPASTEQVRARIAAHLDQLQVAFAARPSVGRAAELTSAAALAVRPEAAADAAEYLLMHAEDTTFTALSTARQVLGLNMALPSPGISSPPLGRDRLQEEVRRLKAVVRAFPRNPLAHVDLARMYAALGVLVKAERHLAVALSLAPQHRLTLRAAVRFHVHAHDPREAVRLLRQQPVTLQDPWLMAAEISAAMVAGLPPRSVRRAREVLENREFLPLHTSELAAALGTLELTDGKTKRGRKLFQQALERPTENAVAQVQWAAPHVRLEMDGAQLIDVPRNFEARGQESYEARNYVDARAAFVAWFQDEPFSSTPAIMAGYLSHLLDETPGQAIELTRLGLAATPEEQTLLNNMAFYLANDGQLDLAEHYLTRAQASAPDDELGLTLRATEGLIAFRRGDPARGAELYEDALRVARSLKNTEREVLARLYYARELARSRDPQAPGLLAGAYAAAVKLGESGAVLTARRVVADAEAFLRT
ncbi:hypothetical protein [Deinococcus budaensis]|uniref:Tfp pilus assembly protein PilF n=1 Tax=Deinococcus budaensis TaxID=1665626 RepID=A0A7W8GES4_9DEIO|nr:hypothetical protein [Deinococcus budaensis]MBB5234317.1 Tfp pilus assembly protein PilF [Deinococcus budaensis]